MENELRAGVVRTAAKAVPGRAAIACVPPRNTLSLSQVIDTDGTCTLLLFLDRSPQFIINYSVH